MEKITRFIPMGILLVYLIKTGFAHEVQSADAAIVLFLACLCGYFEFKLDQKIIATMKADIKSLQEDAKKSEKRDEEIRNHVNGLKMANGIRSANIGR